MAPTKQGSLYEMSPENMLGTPPFSMALTAPRGRVGGRREGRWGSDGSLALYVTCCDMVDLHV